MPLSPYSSLADWLGSIGLERFDRVQQLLADNDIGADIIRSLEESDFEKLGISMGDRKRLVRAIEALRATAESKGAPAGLLKAEAPASELRQLTIMFCDLVDSTALCERLTPEQWREVVLAYQQSASAIIERHGGAIAQYLGDGLLVYFGHPQAYEDTVERALLAGLSLVGCIPELKLRPASAHEELRLSLRIGIHTGQVVIGEIGAGARREQLALGDAPNLAARLQSLAHPDTVVISDTTRKLAGGGFEYQDLGHHHFKGISLPRQVWQVTQVSAAASRFDAATSHASLSPLMGRAKEIGLLKARWRTTLQGEGQAVLMSGEAGIGKSRVVKELRDRLGNAGLNAVRLQCSSHHLHRAFHACIDYLERTLGLTRDMPDAVKLDRLEALVLTRAQRPVGQVALLANMLSIPTNDRYGPFVDSANRREQDTASALVDLMQALAAREPALVLLEDAHWADPATLAFAGQLIERLQACPLMLVVTHRPEFEPPWPAQPHVAHLKVGGLSEAQITSLVSQLSDGQALPSDLIRHIVDKTDGVPLFVEELTRSILEQADHSGGVTQGRDVPDTLRDSLMARLDRFAAAREIAQIGAVVGREFSQELVEALADMPPDKVADALGALAQSGLATQQGTHQGTVYAFKHALVRDAAYDSLLTSRREALHGRLVQVVEARFPDVVEAEPELLARHATAARQPAVAIPYWRRASEQALQRLALTEAAAHVNAGLNSTAALPPSPDRDQIEMQLHASLGSIHMLGKGWAAPEVSSAYARAHELARAADKVEESVWPLWGVAIFHLVQGQTQEAERFGERMVTVARQSNSRNIWLVTNMLHTQLCLYSGRFEEVAPHCQQLEHRYCDPQDRALINLYSTDLKLVSMVHGSQARWIMGETADAEALCQAQERFAATLHHPYSMAWVLTWGAMSYLHRGDVPGLVVRVDEGLRIAEEHGFAYVVGMAGIAKGWARTRQGELEAGIEQMRRSLDAFKATGAGIAVPFFQTLLAEALGQAWRPQEGLALLDDAWARIEQGGERWHEAELHRVRGRLLTLGAQADLGLARASFRRAIDLATQQHALSWRRRAEADLAHWL